jgi:hypothetical protein
MFSIETINKSSIKVIENGNIHVIDMKLKYWDELSINLKLHFQNMMKKKDYLFII